MARISKEFIQDLHDRLDIEDVVSSYVSLKRTGRNFKGLCPFHNEKTASFTVYPETKSFYCFGCGASGDVISFVMRMDNLDYVEAVKACAEKAGMNMPEDDQDDSLSKMRVRILSANREAARFFHSRLTDSANKNALNYFLSRNLSPETIAHFGLGYAPDSWTELTDYLRSRGFSDQELLLANLSRQSSKNDRLYDNFRNRVMFPIIDVRGNVIAFGGRVMDDSKPKYVNTSDTPVYKKSKGVFALNFAKNSDSKQLILVEGYMDVIALHQAGITNAIACLGTAFTEEMANLLARYADEILICYDNDEAGRKATQRVLPILGRTSAKIRVIKMEGGKDADEIIRKYGKERFLQLISSASNTVEYRLLEERSKYNVETDDGKVKYLSAAAMILADCSVVEKEVYSSSISAEFNVSKSSMDTQIKKAESIRNRQRQEERKKEERAMVFSSFEDKNNPERKNHLRAARAEEMLIASLMRNNDFYASIREKISPDDYVTQFNKRVFTRLTELIDGGYSTDISMFTEVFSPVEMDSVYRISKMSANLANSVKECEDFIKVIKEEKESGTEPEIMNDEAFLEAFHKKKGE